MKASRPVSLSAMDKERFGKRTAKTGIISRGDIPEIMDFCKDNHVDFLISRCSTDDLEAAQAMEGLGFNLMDTLIYYSCKLMKSAVPQKESPFAIRHVLPGEEMEVKAVAEESFKGYLGHYHADPRLDRTACDNVYIDWAYRSCISRELADTVLIAVSGADIAGFATMRTRGEEEGEGVLFGVSPRFQGKGIYRQLMVGGMKWCLEKCFGIMTVSTQITNTAVQKVWIRLGFEPTHSYYTFHKWFMNE